MGEVAVDGSSGLEAALRENGEQNAEWRKQKAAESAEINRLGVADERAAQERNKETWSQNRGRFGTS